MKQFEPQFSALEQQFQLPSGLLSAVAKTESAGNTRAVSKAGAQGLFQFMPATAKEYGIDPFDPAQASQAAAKKLRGLIDRYQGDTAKALQAYNWGEGNMASGKPMPKETRDYAPKVLGKMSIDPGAVQWDAPQIDPGAVQWDAAEPQAPANPVDGMGSGSRMLAGVGAGMARVGRAVKQAIDAPAAALERTFGGESVSRALGMPTAVESQAQTVQDIASAKETDKPLLATGAGKVGNVAGSVAGVLPAMLIPGANTYLGATAIGAGTGALTTEGGLAERAQGAAAGAVGGLAGKGLGDALGAAASKVSASRAASAAAKANNLAPKMAAAKEAQAAGYVIPPADVKSTVLSETLNGLSGKIKTAQVASARNQSVTNDLIKKELGLPIDQPVTRDALNSIRRQAGSAYDAVRNTGTIQSDNAYKAALDNAVSDIRQVAQDMPDLADNATLKLIDGLKADKFDASTAVSAIRRLRDKADAAFASGDKSLGRVFKAAAGEVEALIDRHLVQTGQPTQVLQAFREARQTIAKTYTVEKALNNVTGDINAQALAKELAKGRPLSGEIGRAARVASAFPRATQQLKEAPKALSPLDYMGGLLTGTASGNPMLAAATFARPGVRSAILSAPYQRSLLNQNTNPGALSTGLLDFAQSDALRRSLPGLLGFGAANASQQ